MTRRWLLRLWPRNLAGRTALLLLVSLTVFHLGSLWMHQHGIRDAVAELDEARVVERLLSATRTIIALPIDERDRAAHDLSDPGLMLGWNTRASIDNPAANAREAELQARLVRGEPSLAAGRVAPSGDTGAGLRGSLPLPDGTWLNFVFAPMIASPGMMGGADAVASTSVMAVGILGASMLLVRWLTGPLRRIAQAADSIGRGRLIAVPQDGPEEVQRVARALDAMQARITRLVDDRTRALAAVSHDLRTPITRLRLRAGFLDDHESQVRMEADLDEMEGMISATLAYLQGEADKEPPQLTDVGALLATLCDAAADAGQQVSLEGPAHFDVLCRHVALRRAVSNLIGNAVSYGGSASVRLAVRSDTLHISVEDSGLGIPNEELDRVFEPFHRLEASRNRSTGGVGLGLTIARQAVEDQGGTLALANRSEGGLRAVIRLPLTTPPVMVTNGPSPGRRGLEHKEQPYAPT